MRVGKQHFYDFIRRHAAERSAAFVRRLEKELESYGRGQERSDDVALITFWRED